MVVIGRRQIARFVEKHPECGQELAELVRELESSKFASPKDLHDRFPSSKVLDGRIVVFRIRGNRYRLSAQVAYNTQVVLVIAVETHAEYDRRTLR